MNTFTRLITGLCIGIHFIPVILHTTTLFNLHVYCISLLSQKELLFVCKQTFNITHILSTITYYALHYYNLNNVFLPIFILCSVSNTLLISHNKHEITLELLHNLFYDLFHFLYIIYLLYYNILLHDYSKELILNTYITIISFDTLCYFAGKLFGKTSLSVISPNKTKEGLVLGALSTYLCYFVFLYPLQLYNTNHHIHCIIIIYCAFIGDLFASFIKRIYHCKDTGTIVIGH